MTQFKLNGRDVSVESEDDTPLLWVVRDELGLIGSKFGCGAAQCGACTMYLDGQPIRSCVTAVSDVSGKEITTIEGLSGKVADAVRDAWVKLDVVQCGYCQSGQIMAAAALLSDNPKPTDDDIDGAMTGNICRCNTYQRIRAAIHVASDTLKA
ncbi:2Fe-2S iron-sulfur cluster-binding protein [Hyphomicrobium sp. LHD-15]|uniref:(2Fe-2S)-binding protein n=1 Tax=Hyphomicrobium sp. LHD-15 TaxID=3072142 RepID=UPI00280F2B1D|nr:2Fe-2S iron-sulfur cluster-binding protein [Hyphomicrobium sp. LHD-15]MDQ8699625.1 (2Fe-2S)-binding protein [Hyphomicrobium sp. LHD-15]